MSQILKQKGSLDERVEKIVMSILEKHKVQYIIEDGKIEKQRLIELITQGMTSLIANHVKMMLDPISLQIEHLNNEVHALKGMILDTTPVQNELFVVTPQPLNDQTRQEIILKLQNQDNLITKVMDQQFKIQSKWNEFLILYQKIDDKFQECEKQFGVYQTLLNDFRAENKKKSTTFWISMNDLSEKVDKMMMSQQKK
ncbi:hypothetical protein pb186bvf_009834 [Paramecium bursaria]